MNILTLDTVLDFGKYKNLSVKQIMQADPSYLLWVHSNLIQNYVFHDVKLLNAVKQAHQYEKDLYDDLVSDMYSIY